MLEDEPDRGVNLRVVPDDEEASAESVGDTPDLLTTEEQALEDALLLIFSDKNIARLHWLADEYGVDVRAAANVSVSNEARSLFPLD